MLVSLARWGLFGCALIYALEAMAVPVPIEVPFVIQGQLIYSRPELFWVAVVTIWLASSAGNLLAFFLARRLGRGAVEALARRFRIAPERIDRTVDWFRRRGVLAVIVTRWINWGYGISLWAAGFSGAPAIPYLGTVLVNTFFWAWWWTWASLYATQGIVWLGLPPWAVAAPALLLALILLVVQRWLRKRL